MIFSIHVPKTGGTSFRHLLQQRYGDRFATYYGPKDPNTDPRLDAIERGALVAALPQLEAAGVEILHGHLRADRLHPAITDPRSVWMWLRNPVERIISHYFFLLESDSQGRIATRMKTGEIDLLEFAASKRSNNLQSRFLGDLPVEQLGFVGLMERYDDCVRLLLGERIARPVRVFNRTRQKPEVDAETRRRIAELNARDMELYERGKAVVAERLETLPPPEEGSVQRLRGWFGRSA
jgi:hypothetical protein